MKAIKTLLCIASLAAAGTAFADSAVVNLNNASQSQSGSRNKQLMELGTVDGGAFSGGTARVTASNLRQTQSGSRNTQKMILGKIDKDFGNHSTNVVARNVSQSQSGSRNEQTIKVGVVE
jgi:hypothetical protein